MRFCKGPEADLACRRTAYQDVEKYRPGVVQAYRDWFTVSILVEFAKAYQSLTSSIDL